MKDVSFQTKPSWNLDTKSYGNASSSVPKFQKVEKPLTRKMLGVLKKNGLAEKQKYPEQELEPNTVLMDGHIIKNCHPCFLDVIRSWDSKKMEHLLSQPVNASNYIVPIEDNCTVAEFLKNQQNYCGRRKFTFPCVMDIFVTLPMTHTFQSVDNVSTGIIGIVIIAIDALMDKPFHDVNTVDFL
ncbi:hypothetical protein FDP41_002726 [Naegleria fowleri]|uniref:Uncharacterized protein n=1 Tax=Naegleria fowleri TaxID=5763 RepID=A0A6A5BUX0_NAEFO|nr:uncharacterized protein FDP41_002726 [Naegleria fowleri]KAF0978211.1 hypothetical protein FDP41_002726 [Naegleria fowleri]